MFSSRSPTIDDLLGQDATAPLGSGDFDDELWLLLTDLGSSADDLERLPEPVWVYLASRTLQWEVDNGGFAQAAFNIPEWFEPAERAYRVLGQPRAADLIAKARALLDAEREVLEEGPPGRPRSGSHRRASRDERSGGTR